LDNRRSNLRQATRSQNSRNRKKRPGCTSLYIGVSWDEKVGKWAAQCDVNRTKAFNAYYDDEISAAYAYDCFVRTNLPGEKSMVLKSQTDFRVTSSDRKETTVFQEVSGKRVQNTSRK
jgi:hypothetical protein